MDIWQNDLPVNIWLISDIRSSKEITLSEDESSISSWESEICWLSSRSNLSIMFWIFMIISLLLSWNISTRRSNVTYVNIDTTEISSSMWSLCAMMKLSSMWRMWLEGDRLVCILKLRFFYIIVSAAERFIHLSVNHIILTISSWSTGAKCIIPPSSGRHLSTTIVPSTSIVTS